MAPDNVIYCDEKVDRLKKCGYQSKKKLLTVGIEFVSHLQAIDDPDNFVLPEGLTKSTFKNIWKHAQDASRDQKPKPVDHRNTPNPYESKFGTSWKKEIKKSPTFSNSIIITDYIEHIMAESEAVMRGTKYQDTWRVYHDALSLMTAKDTKKWMAEAGYLHRWILPTSDLYDNMPDLKHKYNTNPIGNSPEFMPWDAHLNADVHSALDLHCTVARNLPKDDTRKFDASTPNNMLRAYERILDPGDDGVCPPSKRICQDVGRIILSLKMVRAAGGCMIEESNIRSGRRYEDGVIRKRDGVRTK